MIDIDKELEWVREDREDRHIGSISKHECVVDVDWVEELLTEVKQLREQQQKILLIAKANMAVEWSDTDASFEWGHITDLIKGWTELREALVGDSPNWTHEELIERALEISKPVELEFGEWHSDMGEE